MRVFNLTVVNFLLWRFHTAGTLRVVLPALHSLLVHAQPPTSHLPTSQPSGIDSAVQTLLRVCAVAEAEDSSKGVLLSEDVRDRFFDAVADQDDAMVAAMLTALRLHTLLVDIEHAPNAPALATGWVELMSSPTARCVIASFQPDALFLQFCARCSVLGQECVLEDWV
jgi:hypothetical protein